MFAWRLAPQRSSVLSLVMRQGVGLALVGVVIGLVLALFALTRVLEAQLFGVTRTDPATFALVAVMLTLVATMATLIPALRATRLDPVGRYGASNRIADSDCGGDWRVR